MLHSRSVSAPSRRRFKSDAGLTPYPLCYGVAIAQKNGGGPAVAQSTTRQGYGGLVRCRSSGRMAGLWRTHPPQQKSHTQGTCPALAAVRVRDVLDAALAMLSDGGPRNIGAVFLPAPDVMQLREVADLLPYGGDVLDIGGAFGSRACGHGIRLNARMIAVQEMPRPVFDRTQGVACLFGVPAGGNVADWLWEVFRALKVGGVLYGPRELDKAARRMGFQPLSGDGIWKKSATWPITD